MQQRGTRSSRRDAQHETAARRWFTTRRARTEHGDAQHESTTRRWFTTRSTRTGHGAAADASTASAEQRARYWFRYTASARATDG